MLFWNYPCLYQKSDTSTGGITFLQLDSFEHGIYQRPLRPRGDVEFVLHPELSHCARGTRNRLGPISRCSSPRPSKMRTRPSTCPRRSSGSGALVDPAEIDGNKSIYWLCEYVRRAERQLPVAPDTFLGEIAHKHASNGSDVGDDERSGSDASAVALLPRSHFVLVTEVRVRGCLGECGDHRSRVATLRRPQFAGVLECRHVNWHPGQLRTPPQPSQTDRPVPLRLRCIGGQCGAAFWFAGACGVESGGLLRAGWKARPPFCAARTQSRQRLRNTA